MHPVEKYIEAVQEGNARKVADLFTEDGVFHDVAVYEFRGFEIRNQGREHIYQGFINIFGSGLADVEKLSYEGDTVRYRVSKNGISKVCLGTGKVENGLLKEYVTVLAEE